MSARFIAIEGIDGAGTTTQARLITDWMNAKGIPAHQTCEPSQGPVGKLIREILQQKMRDIDPAALALLFAADRVDHVRHEILTKLQQGIHVISDRYVFSSLAYQSLQLNQRWVADINQFAPPPDLTIYIRIDPELAFERRKLRGAPEEIFDSNNLQQRIAKKYDELFLPPAAGSGSSKHDLSDPRGSTPLDPLGSRWIREDLGGSDASDPPKPAADIGFPSHVEILDGALAINSLHEILRQMVQEVATDKSPDKLY